MPRLRFLLVLMVLSFGFIGLSLAHVGAQEPPDAAPAISGPLYPDLTDVPPTAFIPPSNQTANAVPASPSFSGGTTVYTDRTIFTGIYPNLTYEGFETNACSGILGFPAPLNAYTATLCYHRGQLQTGLELRDNPLNEAGGSVNGLAFIEGGTGGVGNDAVVANTFTNTFELYLTPTATAVGLDLTSVTSDSSLRVRVYDTNSNLIYETTFPAVGPVGAFIGFYEANGISKVELFANNGEPGNGAEGLTGVFFGSPGTEISLVKTVGTDSHSCAPTNTIEVTPVTTVTYCYTVTNNSATTFSMHTLTDSIEGPLLTDFRYALAPGASTYYTISRVISATTVNNAHWEVMVPLDYSLITGTCTFPDITATGTPLFLTDDGETNISLPFTFPFYDIKTSGLRVSNNGVVLPGDTTSEVPFDNLPLATSNFRHAILPFWDDLDEETGNVYAGTYTFTLASGVSNSLMAPPGVTTQGNIVYYVIAWVDRSHFPGPGTSTATFAIGLMAPGQGLDGYTFTCYVDTVFGDTTLDNGSSATIGLNQYTSHADQESFNTNRPELNTLFGTGRLPLGVGKTFVATDTATVNVVYADSTVTPPFIEEPHNSPPQTTLRNVTIENGGNSPLTWAITESGNNCALSGDIAWISTSTPNGATAAGDTDTVTFSLNSTGLANGTYNALLCISTNDYNSPLTTIPVTLTVSGSPVTPTPTPSATPTQGPPLTENLYLPMVRKR